MEYAKQAEMCWGMGILNLEAQNISLLSKWLLRLLNEEGIWQNLLKKDIFDE